MSKFTKGQGLKFWISVIGICFARPPQAGISSLVLRISRIKGLQIQSSIRLL